MRKPYISAANQYSHIDGFMNIELPEHVSDVKIEICHFMSFNAAILPRRWLGDEVRGGAGGAVIVIILSVTS